ncbi:MAG: alanine--tRNA ligase [Actinomycetaceae bacterium]|nr:alanine--tRNA ligase [Actinomycetaceae bacterium]MDY6083160.1 alanine--tRNA ligase [Actinomycetaceae bacterium]
MRSAEIRQRWLNYFAKNGHHLADSAPLISPDPSILFTIAGMVPFIPYIVGTEPAPWPRVASVQKCIRTNDIENVGVTTRHGTFFQMCGNFSFGDYFKEGAIDLAWNLLTSSIDEGGYGLDGERIWVTLWEHDDAAYNHWTKVVGLDPKHIVKLTREEIFWSTGQPGPAGPCAEIHYDRGPEFGPEAAGGTVDPGGDRYLEIWNLVFDQYLRGEGEGKDYPLLGDLDRTAIDTGAGLERIAFLLQDKNNMYETDQVYPVIARTEEMTGKHYGANHEDDVRMRVIADHVRSSLMLINDGVRPGNDGRGYVLRRLLRRVVRSIRLLGVQDPVMGDLITVSKDAMVESYPELDTNFDQIYNVAAGEEEAFVRTLGAGTQIFDLAIDKVRKQTPQGSTPRLSGADAFTLHDTYGFPIDLTLEMASEQGVEVDEKAFRALMDEQKSRARADAQAKKTGHVDPSVYHHIIAEAGGLTHFVGYTDSSAEAKVVALLDQSGASVPVVQGPAPVDVILDETPFYAEMGGQLADHGTISVAGGGLIDISDVQAPVKGLHVHHGVISEGTVAVGDTVFASIDTDRRIQIARAHTSTHMVHKVLHEFLGDQATQAGSEDAPSRLRFDFRHGSAIPASMMHDIEARTNERLQDNLEVTDATMPIEEARKTGAMALFGEKYGKIVRVVSIGGDWSKEFCAGTHVKETGQIGLVTVLGESSIGSGVRRIDALVGEGAYAAGAQERALIGQISSLVGGQVSDLPDRIAAMMAKLKDAQKQIASLRQERLQASVQGVLQSKERIGTVDFYRAEYDDVSADELRSLVSDVSSRLSKADSAVVAAVSVVNNRPVIAIATTEEARNAGIKAGALVRHASQVLSGGGGGKDDLAQGGGTDVSKVREALDTVAADLH